MRLFVICLAACFAISACTSPVNSDAAGANAITSTAGSVVDLTFSSEVTLPSSEEVETRAAILLQLQYMHGALSTAENANGHIGRVQIDDVRESSADDVRTIRYTATLPVIWPVDRNRPSATYPIALPKDVGDLPAFNKKYDGSCGSNAYGVETFWHDWNPRANRCSLGKDVFQATATVKPSAKATTDRYPEYDQMLADSSLDVVAVFGLIDGKLAGEKDWGVMEHRSFVAGLGTLLADSKTVTRDSSRSILKDITVTGTFRHKEEDIKVTVTVLLVDILAQVEDDFDSRYDPLSETADMILYNGHAGMGRNVNALARKGIVAKGKYQLVLLNGCDSFAYIDNHISDRRIEVNGATFDPKGTRYLDVIANALPAGVISLGSSSLAVVRAATKADVTFNKILESFPKSQLAAVFGEEDNRYRP